MLFGLMVMMLMSMEFSIVCLFLVCSSRVFLVWVWVVMFSVMIEVECWLLVSSFGVMCVSS